MRIEFLDCLKRERDISIKAMSSGGKMAFRLIHPLRTVPANTEQERMNVREVIPHIGPIPIVIPLKLFLDLPRDPVSQGG